MVQALVLIFLTRLWSQEPNRRPRWGPVKIAQARVVLLGEQAAVAGSVATNCYNNGSKNNNNITVIVISFHQFLLHNNFHNNQKVVTFSPWMGRGVWTWTCVLWTCVSWTFSEGGPRKTRLFWNKELLFLHLYPVNCRWPASGDPCTRLVAETGSNWFTGREGSCRLSR